MTAQPYVYLITCIPTGQFYFGFRAANVAKHRSPENDIWIKYHTSSKKVHTLIAGHGKEQFTVSIIHRGNDWDAVWWKEQEFIKCNITNPLCLNGFFIDPANGNKVFSQTGVPKSLEHRKKLSEANRGKHSNPEHHAKAGLAQRGKILSTEHKEKLRVASTGKMHTAETKQRIAVNKMGQQPFLGRTHSEETKAKISAAAKCHKAFLGRTHSEETKAKMRAAWERRRLAAS